MGKAQNKKNKTEAELWKTKLMSDERTATQIYIYLFQ